MRCPSTHCGARCDLERGHRGRHERGGLPGPEPHLTWTNLTLTEAEVADAADEMVREEDYTPERAATRILEILRERRLR